MRDEAIRRRLDPASRDTLQDLGEQLIAEGWYPFCRAVLTKADWGPGRPLIVDGIRHVKALETLRAIVAPMPVRLVYLGADAVTRALRLQSRAGGQESDFRTVEKHSTEIEVSGQLSALADYVTETDREATAIAEEIVVWLGRA